MARTLTVDIFLSVDGWAGGDGLPGYFGYLGPELEEWITAELAAPQLVVMGRRTYEALAAYPDEPGMTGLDKVVFSGPCPMRPGRTRGSAVRTLSMRSGNESRQRRSAAHHGQRFPGPAAHRAGLVDRLRLMIFPLIAGDAGRDPFFADMASADLELAGHRVLDGRVLLVEYQPTGKDIPRA